MESKREKLFQVLLLAFVLLYVSWHLGRWYENKQENTRLGNACLERVGEKIEIIPTDGCLEYYFE